MTPATTGHTMAAENMSRSGSNGSHGSSEAPKPKRKGTRSVASLTPQQLARKRANDREAQRAIRQRTKEHIERLEKEVATLKESQKNGAMLALIERNRHLEAELHRLKAALGYPAAASGFHSSPVFDEGSLGGGVTGASPRSSPYPASAFDALDELTPTAPFMTMENAPLYVTHSNASSPASSSNQEEFTTYIPSTLGPSMAMGIASQQAAQMQFRGDFDDGDAETMYSSVSQQQYRHRQQPQAQQQPKQHQPPTNWPYQDQGYYASSNSPLQSTA